MSSLFLFCVIYSLSHQPQSLYLDEMIQSFRWLDCISHTSSCGDNELESFLLQLLDTYNDTE